MVFNGEKRDVKAIITQENMEIQHLTLDEYLAIAASLVRDNAGMAEKVRQGGNGKVQWFVGQMVRRGKGKVDAHQAKMALETILCANNGADG